MGIIIKTKELDYYNLFDCPLSEVISYLSAIQNEYGACELQGIIIDGTIVTSVVYEYSETQAEETNRLLEKRRNIDKLISECKYQISLLEKELEECKDQLYPLRKIK